MNCSNKVTCFNSEQTHALFANVLAIPPAWHVNRIFR